MARIMPCRAAGQVVAPARGHRLSGHATVPETDGRTSDPDTFVRDVARGSAALGRRGLGDLARAPFALDPADLLGQLGGDIAALVRKETELVRAEVAEKVSAAVRAMHSYTTPAILVIPLESVDPDYHAWIEAETAEADV